MVFEENYRLTFLEIFYGQQKTIKPLLGGGLMVTSLMSLQHKIIILYINDNVKKINYKKFDFLAY
jgi:hypothetical protein